VRSSTSRPAADIGNPCVWSPALEIGHFADCLRPGSRPLPTEKEGIDVLCLILAAYKGSRSRSIAAVARIQDL
jgi:hypothetical protein